MDKYISGKSVAEKLPCSSFGIIFTKAFSGIVSVSCGEERAADADVEEGLAEPAGTGSWQVGERGGAGGGAEAAESPLDFRSSFLSDSNILPC